MCKDGQFLLFLFIISFYLGGYESRTLDLAAKYDGKWERLGNLMQPRNGHGSLLRGSNILHIGGFSDTEV